MANSILLKLLCSPRKELQLLIMTTRGRQIGLHEETRVLNYLTTTHFVFSHAVSFLTNAWL